MTTPVLASAILLRRLMASLQALIAQGAAVVYHVWQDFLFFSLMKPFSLSPWENIPGMYNKGHHLGQGNVQLNLCFYPQGPGS